MSRSRKHNPFTAWSMAESCKEFKRKRSRAERAQERILLHDAILGDEIAEAELSNQQIPWNEWTCPRDGKPYVGGKPWAEKCMRK